MQILHISYTYSEAEPGVIPTPGFRFQLNYSSSEIAAHVQQQEQEQEQEQEQPLLA